MTSVSFDKNLNVFSKLSQKFPFYVSVKIFQSSVEKVDVDKSKKVEIASNFTSEFILKSCGVISFAHLNTNPVFIDTKTVKCVFKSFLTFSTFKN
jgi:hypothetical protein